MLFNLIFTNITILSGFVLFFLIIDLYFLIFAVIAQVFISTAKLVILVGIPTKEAKVIIEIYPVITETKTSKCSV